MVKQNKQTVFVIFYALFFLVSCLEGFAENEKKLMMATTTSTDNTGLLDIIKPAFEKATGIELQWTATGTGKALKLGENCDVDVLMVHAPITEKKYIESGFGINRRQFMYNDFVIVGPENDPAGIKGKNIKEAISVIASKKNIFISRGDNSGTHKKELSLWNAANLSIPDKNKWYVQTGQGMLTSLNVAEQRNGYTLADRGTIIKYQTMRQDSSYLRIVVEGEAALLNQYSVMAVNPGRCPQVKFDMAMEFIDWVTGENAQDLVREFKLMGKPLFTPNAKNK